MAKATIEFNADGLPILIVKATFDGDEIVLLAEEFASVAEAREKLQDLLKQGEVETT